MTRTYLLLYLIFLLSVSYGQVISSFPVAFDAFGKEIITQPFSGLQTDINVSSLSKGIYYLKCDQLEGQVYKFVKN